MSKKAGAGPNPFAHLAAESSNDDTPVVVPIVNRKEEPYVGSGGPVVFHVVGEYSKTYRLVQRKLTDQVLKAARKNLEFDADDADESHVERIAGAVVGWENVEDASGKLIPFSTANCVAFLTVAPWVLPQVEKALKAHDRFFDRASAS